MGDIHTPESNTGLIDGQTNYRPDSNYVQKVTIAFTSLAFTMLVIIMAIAAATFDKTREKINVYNPNVTTIQQPVGLPGNVQISWEGVVNQAKGTTVNFFTCGGCPKYNIWIDSYLTPQLKTLYNINLVRKPITGPTSVALQLVEDQIALKPGASNVSVDLIWLNLENFARLRNPPSGGSSNAYGPWAMKIPSAGNFDFSSPPITFDGGLPTAGYEFPYDGAQCVFIYNGNKVASEADLKLIHTVDGLKAWITANPGKFTYAAPAMDASGATGDYTGSAFIRHVFYTLAAPYTDFLTTADTTALYNARAPKFFQFLRDIEPALYSAAFDSSFVGRTHSYPKNNSIVDTLFGRQATYLTISYTPSYAADMVAKKAWDAAVVNPQAYVLTGGTLANTNFVAIPVTSKNKLGAVVAANFLGSPQANYYRALTLGALPVVDLQAEAFTTGGWQAAFDTIDRSPRTPSAQQLAAGKLAELSPAYITKIQRDWYTCVRNYVYGNATANPKYCG